MREGRRRKIEKRKQKMERVRVRKIEGAKRRSKKNRRWREEEV